MVGGFKSQLLPTQGGFKFIVPLNAFETDATKTPAEPEKLKVRAVHRGRQLFRIYKSAGCVEDGTEEVI